MLRKRFGILGLIVALAATMLAGVAGPASSAEDTVVRQSDMFSRVVPVGWGEAATGGAWRLSTVEGTSVNGSEGLIFLPRGSIRTASLPGVLTGALQASTTLSYAEVPRAGEVASGLTVRREGGAYYYARVRTDAQGDSFLSIQGQPSGAGPWALTEEVRLGRVAGGGVIHLVAASDSNSESVGAKAWLAGTPEPATWQVTAFEPSLPRSGEVGIRAAATLSTPGLQVAFDNFEVLQLGDNLPPVAAFTATTDGLTLEVDGSTSTDPDGTITAFDWDYGDGSTATGVQPPPKTFAANGTYTVALTVTDNEGASNTTTQDITVNADNAPPTAAFTVVIEALQITVDPSGSFDNDGTIEAYHWDFGDGATSDEVAPTHTYAAAGVFPVKLTVTDDQGATGQVTQQVTATQNNPPTAQFIFTTRGLDVLVTGRVSTDDDGEIVSFTWNFGDGTTATGETPPVHTFASAGTFPVTLTVTDNHGATGTVTHDVEVTAPASPEADPGAKLPIIYNLTDLDGTLRFVAPNGSDESGNGSEANPYRTLKRAVAVAQPGDSVVLRGGTYEISDNIVSIGKANLTVTAYPGELPIFDGSQPAPTTTTTEGSMKWFAYTPMIAKTGEGLNLEQLPDAKFDSAGKPTGLAVSRGWRCVKGADYDPPGTSGSGSRCPSGTKPKVITALYPDQVWVDGQHLIQVHDKNLVKPGYFFVPRDVASDDNPGNSRMYLSSEDAADMSKVRVSASEGNFIHVPGDGVTLQGFRVQNHSPAWPFFAVTVTSAVSDFTASNLEFDYVTSVAFKIAGGDAGDQSGLTVRPTLDRVTINRSSWIGLSQLYTDDGVVSNSVITLSNFDKEFNTSPKSGGIKATKTHNMQVIGSDISANNGHGIWWDQSNFGAVLANSRLQANSDSAVFYEISHGLTMVNNVLTRGVSPSSSASVRLAGTSQVLLVNNTIVGGQIPTALASDPRSKFFGSNNRPCAEHPERYRQGGSVASDCPPALSSDLDKARPGEFGSPNLTPGMNWRPSAVMMVNNVFADPIPGSGGLCPGGYPLCVKSYAGSSSDPDVVIPANQVLPQSLIMNGNVYQSSNTVAQSLVQSGGQGAFTATTLDQLRGTNGLGSSFFQLGDAEENAQSGTGFVGPDGTPTDKLAALHGSAAPAPTDPIVNEYIPAGTRHYGALRTGGPAPLPDNLPTAAFDATVTDFTVAVDASASTFPQGEIIGYAWDFGDDTGVELGQQVEHVYDLPGTYTITLVVVGDTGGFNYATREIVIVDPDQPALVQDTFNRLLENGWGNADVGGAWTLNADASNFAVNGDRGVFELAPGKGWRTLLKSPSLPEADVHVLTGTAEAITGNVFVSLMPRVAADNSAYRAKVSIGTDGNAKLSITRVNASGAETTLKNAANALPGVVTGTPLHVRSEVTGASPTTIRAKIWIDGTPEPEAWQLEVTDSTAGLQGPGGVGINAYESSSATAPIKWLVDDLLALPPGS